MARYGAWVSVGAVTVEIAAVTSLWRAEGRGECWIELRTTAGTIEGFAAAVEAANLQAEPTSGAHAQLQTRGPNGFVTLLAAFDESQLTSWLECLADLLTEDGFVGVLGGARPARSPRWAEPPRRGQPRIPPQPAAFIAWNLDLEAMTTDGGRFSRWYVAADRTARIAAALAGWAKPAGPGITLYSSAFTFEVTDESIVAPMLIHAASTGMTGVHRFDLARRRMYEVHVAPGGESTLRILDESAAWQDHVDRLRQGIILLPADVTQALVRPVRWSVAAWVQIGDALPLPGLREADLRCNRHLLVDYVPDAHGIQVLRDEHLAKARDLSGWDITDLGHGRHLVEARDLAAWYATPLPDPAVLEQARHDFGDMILTKEVIAANPPPWARPS